MAVRLAFAVQALSDPDILVVDEALAVGDVKFQAKCFERLKQLKNNGTSILLVTHSSEQIVTHCSRAILIERGRVHHSGSPKDVINVYHDLVFGKKTEKLSIENIAKTVNTDDKGASPLSLTEDLFSTHPGYNPHEYRWGDGAAQLLDYILSTKKETYPEFIDTNDVITLKVSVRFLKDIEDPIFGFTLKTHEGVTIYGTNTERQCVHEFSNSGKSNSVMVVESLFSSNLAPGPYFISIGVASRKGDEIVPHDRRYDAIHFQINPNPEFYGLANLSMRLTAKEES